MQKNGTNADGLWEIYSGVKDNSRINQIRSVNGNETIGQYWNTPECNKVKGCDGMFFPPYVKKTDRLYVYATEACRSAW